MWLFTLALPPLVLLLLRRAERVFVASDGGGSSDSVSTPQLDSPSEHEHEEQSQEKPPLELSDEELSVEERASLIC